MFQTVLPGSFHSFTHSPPHCTRIKLKALYRCSLGFVHKYKVHYGKKIVYYLLFTLRQHVCLLSTNLIQLFKTRFLSKVLHGHVWHFSTLQINWCFLKTIERVLSFRSGFAHRVKIFSPPLSFVKNLSILIEPHE